MAARELRYHYFDQLLQSIDAECVCVAHHQDDIAETMLINLLRGTGIHGLTGIQPRRGNVVRPLLCVSREEIIQFLGSIGQDYVTDSTNLQDDVLRNHLRLNVMPLLRQSTPAAVGNMVATARRMSDACQLYDKAVTAQLADALVCQTPYATTYRLSKLLQMESLLFEALSPFGFTPKQVEDMYPALLRKQEARGKKQEARGKKQEARSKRQEARGKKQEAGGEASQWSSSAHTAVTHGDALIIYRNDDPHLSANVKPHTFPIEGRYQLGDLGTFNISTISQFHKSTIQQSNPFTAFLDADKVVFPLHLRPAATGDRFQPYGMNGSKLVSDYLTDRKRSLYEKRCQLVMTDETGEILWLVGERTDQRFAVTDSTKKVVKVETMEQREESQTCLNYPES